MIIHDLISMVQDKLRGRSDLSAYSGTLGSDIPSWIYEAILDLTPSYPFEELIARGPYVNFIVGQAEYLLSFFLPPNSRFTQVRSFFRFFGTTNPPITNATNVVGNQLKARTTMVVEPMSTIPGLPQYWSQVIVYSAAIRACDFLGMNDVGFGYYKLLHGDPKQPMSVGLLQARESQLRRNLSNNERQMQPIVRRYT